MDERGVVAFELLEYAYDDSGCGSSLSLILLCSIVCIGTEDATEGGGELSCKVAQVCLRDLFQNLLIPALDNVFGR